MAKAKLKNGPKKIDRQAAFGYAVNFCSTFVLVFTLGMLLLANIVNSDTARANVFQANIADNCACANKAEAKPEVFVPVTAEAVEQSIKIIVDDGGFREKELKIPMEGTKMIEITNRGVNSHSFVIGGMMVDSGEIEPGETSVVAVGSLANAPQNFYFYSNFGKDDRDTFSGMFTVE